ncbi:MAG: hypothetical protein CMJ34_14900 [Phycisphaerae bacterium]|nr:hypothetical protein [Phycisphaerae bacterium]
MSCSFPRRFASSSLVLLLGLLLATVGAGCDSSLKQGFRSVSTGMTADEVRGLLGEPSVVVPGETGEGGARITGPRWQYGDNLSTIATAATFPRTVPDRVWVVWFDVDGRVMSRREPLWEAGSSVESAADVEGRSPIFSSPIPARNR